jgi:hypothetical protein
MTSNPDDLIEQYRQLHATSGYGATSVKNLRFLRPEIMLLHPRSILDYGCGQSPLLDRLELGYPVELHRYDPAIPSIATPPAEPVDLLINVDVLEHVPEADLDRVVGHMASLAREAIIIVDTEPAGTVLPNGENAHCTLHPHAWWADYLNRFFPTLEPIKVKRRRRAAFRTWRRKPGDELRFLTLRLKEDARFWYGKAQGLLGGGSDKGR